MKNPQNSRNHKIFQDNRKYISRVDKKIVKPVPNSKFPEPCKIQHSQIRSKNNYQSCQEFKNLQPNPNFNIFKPVQNKSQLLNVRISKISSNTKYFQIFLQIVFQIFHETQISGYPKFSFSLSLSRLLHKIRKTERRVLLSMQESCPEQYCKKLARKMSESHKARILPVLRVVQLCLVC